MTGQSRVAPQVVVMGPSGSGKTAVSAALAVDLGVEFIDADDLHPAANVAKMVAGHSLDDTDRMPWLDIVGRTLAELPGGGGSWPVQRSLGATATASGRRRRVPCSSSSPLTRTNSTAA